MGKFEAVKKIEKFQKTEHPSPIPAHHVDHNLDSDESGEDDRRIEDNRRIEKFFAIQEQRFLDRWDNFLARFHQRQMRALEDDVEIVDIHPAVVRIAAIGEQPGAVDVELPEIIVLRDDSNDEQRNAQQVMEGRVEDKNGVQNPQPNFFQVDYDGRCAVCWEREPDQIINPWWHSFFLQCIQTLETSGYMRCPLCHVAFFNREPVIFPNN